MPMTTHQIEQRLLALAGDESREAQEEIARLRALLRCPPHTQAETRLREGPETRGGH